MLELKELVTTEADFDPQNGVDPLTGLPDEASFGKALQQCLDQCQQRPVKASLALLQLANFYEIRRWVGPTEATIVLSDVVQAVKRCLPSSVIACRCKHHEFALLMREECSENAIHLMERIQSIVESAVSKAIPPQLSLKCGVGLTTINAQDPSVDVLFARARLNISQSSSEYRSITPASDFQHNEILKQLGQALREDGLQLLFQPIIKLDQNDVAHYEVRIRLQEAYGEFPTQLLFELATQRALAERIDRWVVENVLRYVARKESHNTAYTINLSLNSLTSTSFLPWLKEKIANNASITARLILQISEIDVLIAQHYLQQFSRQLYKLNIKLGIRHFGCTPNPFKYLSLVRLHQVRLDGSLVVNLNTQSSQRKRLRKIVAALRAQDIEPIACLIEEPTLLPLLWDIGVFSHQGNCLQPLDTECDYQFPAEQSCRLTL